MESGERREDSNVPTQVRMVIMPSEEAIKPCGRSLKWSAHEVSPKWLELRTVALLSVLSD